jgi:hypothetical protein
MDDKPRRSALLASARHFEVDARNATQATAEEP